MTKEKALSRMQKCFKMFSSELTEANKLRIKSRIVESYPQPGEKFDYAKHVYSTEPYEITGYNLDDNSTVEIKFSFRFPAAECSYGFIRDLLYIAYKLKNNEYVDDDTMENIVYRAEGITDTAKPDYMRGHGDGRFGLIRNILGEKYHDIFLKRWLKTTDAIIDQEIKDEMKKEGIGLSLIWDESHSNEGVEHE